MNRKAQQTQYEHNPGGGRFLRFPVQWMVRVGEPFRLAGCGGKHYHVAVMSEGSVERDQVLGRLEAELLSTCARLKGLVAEAAQSLRPFPAFMGMVSLQALEIEPAYRGLKDRGCVVVLPDGRICELSLRSMPGIPGVMEADQLEEFEELDLPAEEYIIYAAAALRAIGRELRLRGDSRQG